MQSALTLQQRASPTPLQSAAAAAAARPADSAPVTPLQHLLADFMSRSETEHFLQQTLETIAALDQTALQHQIVRDTTEQQAQQEAQQSFAEAAAAVHMDDVNTAMPVTVLNAQARALSPTFINITPPSGLSLASPSSSPNPRSPTGMGSRSPGGAGRVTLSPNPHPLDPSHLQVDEVSLRASPTSAARRITPIDALLSHSPSSSPSPPGSPLASPGSSRKRLNKPLNLPSSPRLTSPSPPRSPARHISSPLPQVRSPQSIRPFYFPDGVPASPTTKKREQDLIEQLFSAKPDGLALEEFFPVTTLVCGFSSYCNSALFEKILQLQAELRGNKGKPAEPALLDQPRVHVDTCLHFHQREIEKFDLPTRFFRLLRSTVQPNDPAPAAAASASAAASSASASVAPPPSAVGQPRKFLTRDDFKPIVQEIVNRHPGLEFLESTPEFQLKYAQTVIARIFYAVNRSGNECLSLRELKNSNFLLMLALLDQEDDINKLNDYFSYEHFYVVYCKFWELDEDHDGYIDANDLIQYDDYAMTNKVVERLMAGAGRKLLSPVPLKMNYLDFVIFLISEVDKNNDVSLDFWFNVIDVDGDGIISTFEIEYFFDEQKQRIQSLSQELITFPDIMCQMIDMVKRPLIQLEANHKANGTTATGELRLKAKKSHSMQLSTVHSGPLHSASLHALPSATLTAPTFHSHHRPFVSTAVHTPVQGGAVYNVSEGLFYKKDLRESRMAAQFFNTLFNLNKFVLSEQRDPIRIKQIHDTPQLSDWDRYAISGYYRLAELPEAADAAQAWADMSDNVEESHEVVGIGMEVDSQGSRK